MASQTVIQSSTRCRVPRAAPTSNVSAFHLRLVERKVDPDLLDAAESILEGVRAGEITGMTFAALLHDGSFISDVRGSLFERPTLARGMVMALSDEIAHLQHTMDPNKPR